MVDLFGVDTETWMAVAAGAQTIIIGAAAGLAYLPVREARLTRQNQTRPFVVMDLNMTEPPLIYLTIANLGQTIARHVRIQTVPPLASSLDRDDDLGYIANLRVFTGEIPSLAPGRQIRLLFDSFFQREQGNFDGVYQVKITYEGERRRFWWMDRTRSYNEDSVLDLGVYKNIQYIDRRTIHDVHKQLERIADAVKRWSSIGSGIVVVHREEEREERNRRMNRVRPRAPGENETRPQAGARARLQKVFRDLADRVGPER